ncbi:MAG: glycoside hydrolase family 3 C-terminal domain-containing protein [Rhodospirillales bacterium]
MDGRYPAQAALLASLCPAAIVFVQQWAGEDSDIPDLTLPSGQDALVDAVTRVNRHTVVVLETGGAGADAVAEAGGGCGGSLVWRERRGGGDCGGAVRGDQSFRAVAGDVFLRGCSICPTLL